ncbi:MAG TPA: cell division protein FtsA [Bacteroidales bacterium]|nr:cell division protein FtsA [Bacteroidales bacterium]HOR60381.1 cell division protein FtsA [Bacteroidales bacterium]HPL04647.1 cell division protein FtsA [Bacteroidales bacterium]
MEKNNEIIAALDIGTTKIVAIAGYKTKDNNFEVVSFGTSPSHGIQRGIVVNIDETVRSIKNAILKAEQSSDYIFTEVFVGIAGQHVLTKTTSCSLYLSNDEDQIQDSHLLVLQDQIISLNNNPGEEIIDIIPQSYVVDKKPGIENPVGMKASTLQGNFHVITGKMGMVNNIKKCVQLCDLKIKSLILEPIASSEAVLSKEEKENNVVMIDIGGGTTDLAIFKSDRIIKTAVIPIGGNTITSDIAKTLDLLDKQAEKLKIAYGAAIEEKNHKETLLSIEGVRRQGVVEISLNELTSIISSRLSEILFSVKFQIENTSVKDNLSAGIVITGGGSLTKNLKQLATFILKSNVRIGYPNTFIVGKYAEDINNPQFSTAIGLIIRGIELLEIEAEEARNLDAINQKLNETQEEDENDKKSKKKNKKEKGSVFNSLLNRMANLFDEDELDENTENN